MRIVIAVSKSFFSSAVFVGVDGGKAFKIGVWLVWGEALMTWAIQFSKGMQNCVRRFLWLFGSLIKMTFASSKDVAAMCLS